MFLFILLIETTCFSFIYFHYNYNHKKKGKEEKKKKRNKITIISAGKKVIFASACNQVQQQINTTMKNDIFKILEMKKKKGNKVNINIFTPLNYL